MARIQGIASIARRARTYALYNYLPKTVDWAVRLATLPARKRIAEAGASRVLIDNTVLAHAVTHETCWINTGRKMWGGSIPIDTGFAARIPVHSEDDQSDAARSVRFLPAIASLAREDMIALFTSAELIDERMTQPAGRFSGYGYYDYSLFSGVKMERLPDPGYSMFIGPAGLGIPSLAEQRRERLADKTDPLFRKLRDVLGPSNSQDAWHIASAENHVCFCFLTMDFRLLRAVDAQRNNAAVSSLKTRLLSPEQLGRLLGLRPVSPRLYSYHRASYPVRSDLNWPASQRRKNRRP
jgi:hypothetical protein